MTQRNSPRRQAGINVEPSLRPWHYSGPNPDGWWCVAPNCTDGLDPLDRVTRELALASELGVANVRIEFPWALIEPRRGAFDWSRSDAIVAGASAAGVMLQPVLVFTPSWAGDGRATSAPRPADFAAFVTAIIARYRRSIRYWEMWNEPDHAHYWTQDITSYTRIILMPGYAAAKTADAEAQVLLGGPADMHGGFFDEIYAAGGGESFDIAAFHDYSGKAWKVGALARELRRLLLAHGQGGKQIWLGEFSVAEDATDDRRQERLLRRVLTQRSPIAMAQWYNLRDDSSCVCCPPRSVKDAYWGLVRRNGARKNGYETFKRLLAAGLPSIRM